MKVFVEGCSFVGKTTLLNALKSNDSSCTVVDEHDVYANGLSNYPIFPSATYKDAVENVRFFYKLEKIRLHDSLSASTALFDRSIFSVILFQKYVESLHLDGYTSAYPYAKDEAIRLVESDAVALPDFIVYLSAEYTTVVERYGREISVGLLRGENAHIFFQKEYEIIATIYEKYGRTLRIVSMNNPHSVDDQTKLILERIKLWQNDNNSLADSKAMALEVIYAL